MIIEYVSLRNLFHLRALSKVGISIAWISSGLWVWVEDSVSKALCGQLLFVSWCKDKVSECKLVTHLRATSHMSQET